MSALAPPKDAEGIIVFNYLKLSLINVLLLAIKSGFDEMSTVLGSVIEGAAKDVIENSYEIPTKVGKPIKMLR